MTGAVRFRTNAAQAFGRKRGNVKAKARMTANADLAEREKRR